MNVLGKDIRLWFCEQEALVSFPSVSDLTKPCRPGFFSNYHGHTTSLQQRAIPN